jgi:hypothetical protein
MTAPIARTSAETTAATSWATRLFQNFIASPSSEHDHKTIEFLVMLRTECASA